MTFIDLKESESDVEPQRCQSTKLFENIYIDLFKLLYSSPKGAWPEATML